MFRWSIDKQSDCHLQQQECYAYYGDDLDLMQNHLYAPGQILGFLKLENNEIHAVVQTCGYQCQKNSIISTRWKQEYIYTGRTKRISVQTVSVESIVRHTLVIPYNNKRDEYTEIWNRDLWADQFLEPTNQDDSLYIDNSNVLKKRKKC